MKKLLILIIGLSTTGLFGIAKFPHISLRSDYPGTVTVKLMGACDGRTDIDEVTIREHKMAHGDQFHLKLPAQVTIPGGSCNAELSRIIISAPNGATLLSTVTGGNYVIKSALKGNLALEPAEEKFHVPLPGMMK